MAAPAGDLDLATARRLEDLLNSAALHSEYIGVDLGSVAFMDCSALTVLRRAHRSARRRGGAVVLVGVKPFFRRILTITRTQDELTVGETVGEAVVAWQRHH